MALRKRRSSGVGADYVVVAPEDPPPGQIQRRRRPRRGQRENRIDMLGAHFSAQPQPQRPRGNRARKSEQRLRGDPAGRLCFQPVAGQGAQILLVLGKRARHSADVLQRPAVHPLQFRKNMVAGIIARRVVQRVGLVLHMGDAPLRQIRLDPLPGYLQQRPDQHAPFFRDPGQSPQTRAPRHAEQHGLGVVVQAVSGGDKVRPVLPGRSEQELIAELPGRGLRAQALFLRVSGHVAGAGNELYPPFITQPPDEFGVRPRSGAQPVVEMGAQAFHVSPLLQQMQQTHGIRAARHRRQHAAARRDQREVR